MSDQEYFRVNEQGEKNEERGGGGRRSFIKRHKKLFVLIGLLWQCLHCGRDCHRG